jgi:HlyD family secretion protein
MKLHKKFIPLLLALVVLLTVAIWLSGWLKSDASRTIDLSGNIELTEVNIAFKIPGKLEERTVDEGAVVKKGMLIARLDQEQLLRQRDRSRAVLASAESRLVQLRTSIQYQRETVGGQIEQRQAELNTAQAGLRDLLAGSRTQEIEQARAAAERSRTEKEKAEKDWQRAQLLYKNEDISTADHDQFKTRYESAVTSLKQAEEQLALVIEGPRRENIEAARAQVARSQAGLKLAEASRLELKRQQQEVATRKAEIDQARAELAALESQLKDSVAVSPIDGVVLAKAAEVGEVLAAGTTVVTVGDLDHPWLRAYINEKDLGRVKLRARVKVTTDSFPGKVYWGRVSFIASEAEFTPKQIQTPEERVKLVYRIKIDVANPEHELKSNMPADAVILLQEKIER